MDLVGSEGLETRQQHTSMESSVFPLCQGVIVLLQSWSICVAPLTVNIIDAVLLHKRGAVAALFVQLWEGNHDLQKRRHLLPKEIDG